MSLENDVIQMWRSNTLRALSTVSEYRGDLAAHLDDLCEFVQWLLRPLIRNDKATDKAMRKFRNNIIDAAAALAVNMRTYPQAYLLGPVGCREAGQGSLYFSKKHLASWTLIDAETGQAVAASKFNKFEDTDVIGLEVFMIHPGLIREGEGNSPDVVVRKPVVLVQFDKKS